METNNPNTASVTFDLSNPAHIELLQGLTEKLRNNQTWDVKSKFFLQEVNVYVNNHPLRINTVLEKILDEFFTGLSELVIGEDIPLYADVFFPALSSILGMYRPYRNNYVQLLDLAISSERTFDFEIFLHFLERVPKLTAPLEHGSQWYDDKYSHFNSITHELFLYTVALCLKRKRYEHLKQIFQCHYFKWNGKHLDRIPQTFITFQYISDTVDGYYKSIAGRNIFSGQAEMITTTADSIIPKDLLVKADMLCYYVALLTNQSWSPVCKLFKSSYLNDFDFFFRMVSMKHFEKIKGIFAVSNIDEFKEKIQNSLNRQSGAPALTELININEIGSVD